MIEITENTETDIEYFKRTLETTTDISAREKIEKQIALMEDALIIYREVRLSEKQ